MAMENEPNMFNES